MRRGYPYPLATAPPYFLLDLPPRPAFLYCMAGPSKEICAKIVSLKMEGRSNIAIAMLLCVKKSRYYEWLKHPLYLKIYEQAQRETVDVLKDSFHGAGLDSMAFLRRVISDEFIPLIDRAPIAERFVDKVLKFAEAKKILDDDELTPDWEMPTEKASR